MATSEWHIISNVLGKWDKSFEYTMRSSYNSEKRGQCLVLVSKASNKAINNDLSMLEALLNEVPYICMVD